MADSMAKSSMKGSVRLRKVTSSVSSMKSTAMPFTSPVSSVTTSRTS